MAVNRLSAHKRPITSARVSTTPVAPFVPTDIAGLKLWLKGDAGVTVAGGVVTVWADQSGNGNDATSLVTAEPTVSSASLNGKDGILFAANKRLQVANALTQTSATCFIVYQVDDVSGGSSGYSNLISFVDSLEIWAIDGSGDNNAPVGLGPNSSSQAQKFSGQGSVDTSPHYLQFIWNGGAVNLSASYAGAFDGTAKTMANAGAFGARLVNEIGDRGVAGYSIKGKIYEILLWDGVLTAGNITSVNTYINGRYGL